MYFLASNFFRNFIKNSRGGLARRSKGTKGGQGTSTLHLIREWVLWQDGGFKREGKQGKRKQRKRTKRFKREEKKGVGDN